MKKKPNPGQPTFDALAAATFDYEAYGPRGPGTRRIPWPPPGPRGPAGRQAVPQPQRGGGLVACEMARPLRPPYDEQPTEQARHDHGNSMRCTIFQCGAAANESELKAIEHLKSRLQSEPGNAEWVLLTNLAFSVTHQLQSDEIDIVAIGPPGVRVVEVKHWSAAWVEARENKQAVEQEADRLTRKARKIGTTLRKVVQSLSLVDAWTSDAPVVHRNLTPRTILVKHDNTPILTGFERMRIPSEISVASSTLPTGQHLATVAPEVQAQGLIAADHRSDLTLGVRRRKCTQSRNRPIAA